MNRILFNGLIYEKNGAGISRYAYKLMDTFIEQNYPIDLLIRADNGDKLKGKNVHIVEKDIASSSKRIIEEQIKQINKYKNYDLVHFPDYATPILYNGLKIATVHDMAMHTMSDKYTLIQNITKKILLKETIKHADYLICDSHFAKEEILSYYPQVEDKVEVVHLGIDVPSKEIHMIKNDEEEIKVLHQLGIKECFMLYVGTIAPHKNIVKLIEAFDRVRKKGYAYQLVIVGKKGWMYEEVFEIVQNKGLEQVVVFTDYISDNTLEVLYHLASFFVSVSLYEGFGFPPLEAMARGCATLVSDIKVFRETCGDAAIYCKPNDDRDIASQMVRLIESNELRNGLKEKGIRQVQRFDWKYTAEKVYKIYKKLLEEKKER